MESDVILNLPVDAVTRTSDGDSRLSHLSPPVRVRRGASPRRARETEGRIMILTFPPGYLNALKAYVPRDKTLLKSREKERARKERERGRSVIFQLPIGCNYGRSLNYYYHFLRHCLFHEAISKESSRQIQSPIRGDRCWEVSGATFSHDNDKSSRGSMFTARVVVVADNARKYRRLVRNFIAI